ncbi:TetR family transcriptional regulator [Alteromonas halophila]|uniref:TetR family transcriptional regulator n=1 Tax=Alteromonas halophila TaxID=516698 RepID=A0A918JK21_9ALTE|nr:TetR family transcriptional regulator [Alteromonas halophila]GGW84439.1 TetR family transcriptional regulator [Alteromonas halophila]
MRRTKEEAENTRQAILDAAVTVFSDRGVAKSTLENIAREAKVTRGAIYWHFANKVEIFDALHDHLHSPFIQRILEGLEVEHADPVGQLQKICTEILTELHEEPQTQKLLTLFLLKCDYSGEFADSKAKFLAKKRRTYDAFAAYFTKAIEGNYISAKADPHLLTLALQSLFHGLVVEFLEDPVTINLQQDGPRLMAMLFASFRHY